MKCFLEPDLAEVVKILGKAAHVFAGKTIVMTGARGFLGRYFTEVFGYLNEHVLEKPCSFIGIDNLLTAGEVGRTAVNRPNMKFVKADVIKQFDHEGALDYVIHAAGIASP